MSAPDAVQAGLTTVKAAWSEKAGEGRIFIFLADYHITDNCPSGAAAVGDITSGVPSSPRIAARGQVRYGEITSRCAIFWHGRTILLVVRAGAGQRRGDHAGGRKAGERL